MRRPLKAGLRIESHVNRHAVDQVVETPLVGECSQETGLLERGQDLGSNAAADEDAADRDTQKRQVAGGRSINFAKQIQRGHTQWIGVCEAPLGYYWAGVGIALLGGGDFGSNRWRFWNSAGVAQEQVDVLKSRARQDALVAY